MNSLQDKIQEVVLDYGEFRELELEPDVLNHCTFTSAEDVTDRILALIAEAMLSEEAVEAGATAVAKDPDKWGYNIILDAYRGALREGIQAAIAAAGVTGAGQEGGEGE